MKISIITAVYNRETTIGRAVRSIQNQTYHDVEHVVIDGASSDRTCDVILNCNSPMVSLISEPDNGIYDAINKGILNSSGDVIGLLHSDDVFAHDEVLSEVAASLDDPAVDAVYADVGFFSARSPEKIARRYNSGLFSPNRLRYGLMPAHTALFLRKSVFDRFGLYKTDYKIAADFEFIARIFKSGDMNAIYVKDIWVYMQMGGASTAGLASNIRGTREVIRACGENGINTNYLKILSKYPLKMLEYIYR